MQYEAPAIRRLGTLANLTEGFDWIRKCIPGGSGTDGAYDFFGQN
jgi:hypothetical protein